MQVWKERLADLIARDNPQAWKEKLADLIARGAPRHEFEALRQAIWEASLPARRAFGAAVERGNRASEAWRESLVRGESISAREEWQNADAIADRLQPIIATWDELEWEARALARVGSPI